MLRKSVQAMVGQSSDINKKERDYPTLFGNTFSVTFIISHLLADSKTLCQLGIEDFCFKNAAQICTGYGWGKEKAFGSLQLLYWQDIYSGSAIFQTASSILPISFTSVSFYFTILRYKQERAGLSTV